MSKYDIGIIGGGQLGKMLIEEGLRYNVSFATLDAELNSPASYISYHHIQGSLYDTASLQQLAAISNVLTYEIEFTDAHYLEQLQQQGHIIIPAPQILKIIQNKALQKQFYTQHHIPTAQFVLVNKPHDWLAALQQSGFTQFAAKLCQGGYDGKGVALMHISDVVNGAIPFDEPCVLEQLVQCSKELSIIVARNAAGHVQCYPAVEMAFDPIANLVTYLQCPADISESIAEQAKQIATQVIERLNGIGIFAVELFVNEQGQVLVNEIAPRPHNSGHHTIEGNYTSQYEQLVRILLNKPLGDTGIVQPSAMVNILGGQGFTGAYKLKHEKELLQIAGVYIHLYHKAESKPNRKLGHITILAPDVASLHTKAKAVMQLTQIVPA
jgi:5-(carboxyamino)imidazole ribonucleotide synthase